MEQIIHRITGTNSTAIPKKRVAAYARVSSGKDAQIMSLAAQVDYYTKFITKQPDWEYSGIYADEAFTGTKDERPDFQRLLADCRADKIDIILTKSVSRFARNMVTTLNIVRELRAMNIAVHFDKEHIDTLGEGGEFKLSVLSAFAEAESKNVSDNCKWRIRNDFKRGVPSYFRTYGYEMRDKHLEVVAEEAAVVRRIFQAYLDGDGPLRIAKTLIEDGVPAPAGERWNIGSVRYILSNERYVGDLVLQKTYSENHLTKKKRMNDHVLPQYIVDDCHEAIIRRDTFQAVQARIDQQRQAFQPNAPYQDTYLFSGIITCGQCGKHYRRKITGSAPQYKKPVWICSTFNTLGKKYCASKQIPENILEETTRQILGLDKLSRETLRKKVDHIEVVGPNELAYHLANGQVMHTVWQDHSRRDSWDANARQRAREFALRRGAGK